MSEPITFHASVDKVQTLKNNDVRVTLDVDQAEMDAALKLAKLKGHRLGIAIVVDG